MELISDDKSIIEYIGSNAFNRTGDLIIYVMNDSIPQNWHSNWYGDNTNLQIGIVIPSVKLTNIFAQKETISFEIEINDIYSMGYPIGWTYIFSRIKDVNRSNHIPFVCNFNGCSFKLDGPSGNKPSSSS